MPATKTETKKIGKKPGSTTLRLVNSGRCFTRCIFNRKNFAKTPTTSRTLSRLFYSEAKPQTQPAHHNDEFHSADIAGNYLRAQIFKINPNNFYKSEITILFGCTSHRPPVVIIALAGRFF
jgi:hypothetical protein